MKRIITILLAVCMIVAVLAFAASCNNTNTTKEPDAQTTQKQDETVGTTATPSGETTANTNPGSDVVDPGTQGTEPTQTTAGAGDDNGRTKMQGYENIDFGGRTFYIATSIHDSEERNNDYVDFWAESYTGDAINDAVYDRNQVMQKLYNCKIEVTKGPEDFNTDVATGTGKFIGYSTAYSIASRVSSSYYNVLKLDCDFTADYFDQAFIRDVSVNGKLFSILGSWAMAAKECTWIMFYNKDVYDSKFSDIDIYQLVRDHEWTYDKMIEFIDKVKTDTDGNQAYEFKEGDNADILGIATTTYNNYALYYCGGLRNVDKDVNGNLVPAIKMKSNASDIIDKILETFNTEGYVTMGYTQVQKAMQNGTTLFAGEILDVLARMKDAENLRVGVLPQPLYNNEQESYYHYVNNQAPMLGLSTTFSDLEVLSNFLTLFAYHSQKIVMPAFLNSYKYTYASDEESSEMVEIILNSLTYDVGYHLGFAQSWIGAIDSMITSNKNQYAQAVARQEKSIQGKIDEFVAKVDAVDDSY